MIKYSGEDRLQKERERIVKIESFMRKVAESDLPDKEAVNTLLNQYRQVKDYYPDVQKDIETDIEKRRLSEKAIGRLRKAGSLYDSEIEKSQI